MQYDIQLTGKLVARSTRAWIETDNEASNPSSPIRVARSTRAWIETIPIECRPAPTIVARSTRAWIETRRAIQQNDGNLVARSTRAWIETINSLVLTWISRRTLYACVD